MSSMTVSELAERLGFTELATRQLIKAGKFEYFAWATKKKPTAKRWEISICRERFELYIKGFDMQLIKKVLEEAGTSSSTK